MSADKFLKIRIYFTLTVSLTVWSLLLWNHFNGGIPSHHLLANEDLPSFSNAWGALLLPLLTWFLLFRVQRRIFLAEEKAAGLQQKVLPALIASLVFGALLSTFFTLGNSEIPFYMMLSVFVIALVVPVYRSEFLLGFVLGMTFTFGAILPTLIGSVLLLIGTIIYLGIRPAILFVTAKVVSR
jgi:hypothetical protein